MDGERAIDMYKEIIALVQEEAYVTTAFLFMKILIEEDHPTLSRLSWS